jgi:predicted glycosyltransferase involved in capsule biosynthesis
MVLESKDPVGYTHVYNKDIIMKLRGYDERIHGWGKEEDDMIERAKRSYRVKLLPGEKCIYHLNHSKAFSDKYNVDMHNFNVLFDNIIYKGKNAVNSYW